MTPQELENRLIRFAARIIKVVENLPKNNPIARHLGDQLHRSGTSPALNYGEARSAESIADFIHKIKICKKELRESYNCLRIINLQNWFSLGRLDPIIQENNELIAIFVTTTKTAATTKEKQRKSRK